ncbi:co-chaperone YbbN [Actinobacillus delphinicola]|uniref:co-chaperone YbbN n=1 Tax=Actinobacillus delphinicola TaxID=51161 RepID=UPI0024414A84|nr:co-chaperone YbbN [Actinobacillus delphinicola]MDG6896979.1 co-chaperone YbbN [Actinobacillus delphinicola]
MQSQFIEITEQNISQVLQSSQQIPVVLNFYAPSMPESVAFLDKLKKIENQYAGQFILAAVNCETQQRLAAQFQLQTLPTTYLFKAGKPIDAIQGPLDDVQLMQHLKAILPSEDELKFQQALEYLEKGDLSQALPLLKEAWQLSDKKNPEIAFIYAETYLTLKRAEAALDVLNQVKLEDRNAQWQEIHAQAELLLKAADTPEIQQLQAEYENDNQPATALKLAIALHQVGKSEDALALLFTILQQDLQAEDGAIKKEFLEILTALGNGDAVTSQYRRKLYSLLY